MVEDALIVELFWQRSEQAIHETDKKYGRYCFSIARRILCRREDAEECVNDTYLGAWNSMPPHRPNVLATFLGKITRRLALGVIRRDTRLKRGGEQFDLAYEELADCLPDNSAERAAESIELKEIICRFLDDLQRSERDVFVLRYWYFASVEEISKRTGFSHSKVKSMLMRTRKRLSKFLEKEEYEYDKN